MQYVSILYPQCFVVATSNSLPGFIDLKARENVHPRPRHMCVQQNVLDFKDNIGKLD